MTHVNHGPNRALIGVVCAVVALVAWLIMLGWLFAVPSLTGAMPGRQPMTFTAALGALLLAGALWALRHEPRSRAANVGVAVCAGLATAIGLLTLTEMFWGVGLHVDDLVAGNTAAGEHLARTAPGSALMLIGTGIGLLLRWRRHRLASQACALGVGLLGVLSLQAWFYAQLELHDTPSFFAVGSPMIGAFLLLAIGLLGVRERDRTATVLADVSNVIGRQLWLPLALMTVAVGTLVEWAQVRKLLEPGADSAFLVIWMSLMASALIFVSARSLNRLHEQLGRSIDERSTAEQLLRRQASLFDQAYEGMVIWRPQGAITFWNRGAEQLYGFRRDEAIGRLPHDLLSTTAEGGIPAMVERLARQRHWEGELHHLHRDGHELIVDTRMTMVEDEGGAFVVAASRDVTERVRAEAALRESERRFRQIAEWLPQLVWTCEPDGWCDFLSQRWMDYTGSTLAREVGYGWLDQVHADDQRRLMTAWMASVQTGTEFRIEFRIRRHDGVYRWFDTRALPLRDDTGRIVKWFGSNTDIDDERTIREALRSNEERLALALEINETAAWDFDLATQQVTRSVEHDRIFGYESLLPEWTFERFIAHVAPDERDRMRKRFERTLTSHVDNWNFDCRIQRADGAMRWIAVRGRSKRSNGGDVRVLSGVVQDVTARKTIEEEILRLNTDLEGRVEQRTKELEDANRELEAFSYSVSHDLRAPLRTMDGFSQAVLEDYGPDLPAEAQRYLKIIRDGAQKMGRLIDDLLAFSRLSRQPLSAREVDMHALVSDAWTEVLGQQRRDVDVTIEPLPAGSGDPALLRQVWLNLLSNALKYSRGRTPARVHVGSRGDHGCCTYFVRDNGTGFDMAYAHKLFGVFQRLHRSEDFEGTGVGLAVVQRIIHRHGGRIWAEAAVDEGATFFFTLGPEKGAS